MMAMYMRLIDWCKANNHSVITAHNYVKRYNVKYIREAGNPNPRAPLLIDSMAQHHLADIFKNHQKEIEKRAKQLGKNHSIATEIFTDDERKARCERWVNSFKGIIPASTIRSWFKPDYELLDPEPVCFKEI